MNFWFFYDSGVITEDIDQNTIYGLIIIIYIWAYLV